MLVQSPLDKKRKLNTEYNPSRDRWIDNIIKTILSKGLPIDEIWLFGSRARGDFRLNSDWDIFVIWNDTLRTLLVRPMERLSNSVPMAQVFGAGRRVFDSSFPRNIGAFHSEILRFEGILIYWKNDEILARAGIVSKRIICEN